MVLGAQITELSTIRILRDTKHVYDFTGKIVYLINSLLAF